MPSSSSDSDDTPASSRLDRHGVHKLRDTCGKVSESSALEVTGVASALEVAADTAPSQIKEQRHVAPALSPRLQEPPEDLAPQGIAKLQGARKIGVRSLRGPKMEVRGEIDEQVAAAAEEQGEASAAAAAAEAKTRQARTSSNASTSRRRARAKRGDVEAGTGAQLQRGQQVSAAALSVEEEEDLPQEACESPRSADGKGGGRSRLSGEGGSWREELASAWQTHGHPAASDTQALHRGSSEEEEAAGVAAVGVVSAEVVPMEGSWQHQRSWQLSGSPAHVHAAPNSVFSVSLYLYPPAC